MRLFAAARLFGAALAIVPSVAGAQATVSLNGTIQSTVVAAGNINTDPRYQTPISPAYNGVGYIQISATKDGVKGVFACTGALLADGKTILTAAHCLQGAALGTVTGVLAAFYDSNGAFRVLGASGFDTHPLYSQRVMDENDIAVVHLAAEAPTTISRYQIYTGVPVDHTFEFVGFGNRGSFGLGEQQAGGFQLSNRKSGENLFDVYAGDSRFTCPVGSPDCTQGVNFWNQQFKTSAGNVGHVLMVDFDSGKADNNSFCILGQYTTLTNLGNSECQQGYGLEEAISGRGDSGGPGFINGQIASVTSFGATFGPATGDIDNFLDSSFGEFAGFTDVSFHSQWIYDHMDLNSLDPTVAGPAVVTPEPSTMVLMASGLFGIAGIARRRRNKKA